MSRLSLPLMAVWLKWLTDGVLEGDPRRVVAGVAGLAGVQSLLFVLSLVGNDLRLTLGERVGFALDREVVRSVAGVPGLEPFEEPATRDRLELLRESQAALGHSLNSLLNVLNAWVGAVGTLWVLAWLDPRLPLLALFALPAIPVARLQERWRKEAEERSATPARRARHLRGLATDRAAGMEARIFGLREEIQARFHAAACEARRPVVESERRVAWLDAGRQVVFTVGYAAAVLFVLREATAGRATAGDVVAAVYLCRQVAETVVSPVFSAARLGRLLRAADRLLWLRDYAAERAPTEAGLEAPPTRLLQGVTFEEVSFTYPGTDQPVLENLSFHLPAGAVVALVGENGAGKTTLVKLLTRMYEPTSGRIRIDGVDLAEIDPAAWRLRLSAAFQDFVRPETAARRAVGVGDLPWLDDDAAVRDALDRAGAAGLIEALPNGGDTRLGAGWPGGLDLSTGQWQKLALGRALMRRDPLLVFFDEPTASLDAPTEHTLFERYAAAARAGVGNGAVTMLVSHRFSTVRSADVILVLEGRCVATLGSHDELMARRGLYARLYELQSGAYS